MTEPCFWCDAEGGKTLGPDHLTWCVRYRRPELPRFIGGDSAVARGVLAGVDPAWAGRPAMREAADSRGYELRPRLDKKAKRR